jgi:2'-hydroxyisoflavone reductase
VKALILGGTRFLGRHVARTLVERGHDTSIFTRGRNPGDETLELTRYVGDRDGGLGVVPREGWDAVIDTSGYVPSVVAESCAHFASAKRYLFVSSISVYDCSGETAGEGRAPYTPRLMDKPDNDPENYGSSKKRCDDVVGAVFDDRGIVVRPGLIVGPYDPTNRFTYWVDRFSDAGDVAAPAPPQGYVQFVDARDLAEFMVKVIEDGRSGIYDVTSPPKTTTMEQLVTTARDALASDSKIVWMDDAFLVSNGITGWMDLPVWVSASEGMPGLMNTNVDRALADGLTIRPLAQTIRDTREWSVKAMQANLTSHLMKTPAGITRERERELLEAWHAAKT